MDYSRRQLFKRLGRIVEDAVSTGVAEAERVRRQEARPIKFVRPPGALPEAEFLNVCTRCTDCIEACPYDAIRRLGPEMNAGTETPAIILDQTPCYLCEDLPCIAACEPNALLPVDRTDAHMALARIDLNRCYQSMGQPCDYCVMRCPLRGEAISWDQKRQPVINESICAGCGACAYICPTDAIDMIAAN